MDSMGHVNNAKYFTYCESARMSYFAAVRMKELSESPQHGPALAAAHLNFRAQVRYPAELEVAPASPRSAGPASRWSMSSLIATPMTTSPTAAA